MPEALRVETIREEVWLRAYEAAMKSNGRGHDDAIRLAGKCLLTFDEEFPKHKQE